MARVSVSAEIRVSPKKLWELMRSFNALPSWHPAVQKSELADEGRVRKLNILGAGTFVERLERLDDEERVYSYSVIDSPLPVANYMSTIRVRDDGTGKNSVVEWSGEFNPAGTSETDAVQAIRELYEGGLNNLKKLFRSK